MLCFLFVFTMRYLIEFTPKELQQMKTLEHVDVDTMFEEGFVTYDDVLLQLYEGEQQLIRDKALITKIFSILDERQIGVMKSDAMTSFVSAVKNYIFDSRMNTDVSYYYC